MTVAVPEDELPAFLALAARREVEATEIGRFTQSGRLVVTYGEKKVCDLSLEFLHGGLPKITRKARWNPPPRVELTANERAEVLTSKSLEEWLVQMLRHP